MNHTPGPWKMDGRLIIDSRSDAVAMVNIARAVTTAHCDSRLIAAAPDLLAALQGLLETSALNEDAIEESDYMLVANARAVIAKATG